MPQLADQAQRDRLTSDLDASLFVEAAAGTGKTTAVVSRIVAAIAAGRLLMERLVAITFTITAAGDLRVRIREGLERAADDDSRPQQERDRCAEAAGQVERARIETIHAFCSALLRMCPIEAGLPPDFEAYDDLAASIDVRERFRLWFDGLQPGRPDAEAVRLALLLGLQPASLLDVFEALNGNWDLLDAGVSWPSTLPDGLVTKAHEGGRQLHEAIALRCECMTPDALDAHLEALVPLARALEAAASEHEALSALFLAQRTIKPNPGAANNWRNDACASIKATLKQVRGEADSLIAQTRTALAGRVAAALRDVVLTYADERRARGVVTYHDMLVRARDLVRGTPAVRDMFRRSWDLVIVDEFQDTDPLQGELAFLLAAREGAVAEDWLQLPLRPGALCVVGDPKQSIYRFRRADIALYAAVKGAMTGASGEAAVTLQVNFRSGRRIVDAVNAVFGGEGGLMSGGSDDGVQASYVELVAHAPEIAGAVHTMGDAVDVRAPEMWRMEAQATAAVITRVLGERWTVGEGTTPGPHPCGPSDICVLMPSRTNLRNLERALEDSHIRYRLESGALIIATQEVRDLLNCLRAIDDPSDEVAIVAALRTPAYGCSDAELLRWREAGGRWSYMRPGVDSQSRIAAALHDLRQLHGLRLERTPPALIEELIERRLLRAAAAAGWRPREALRRQRFVLDQVAAIGRTGRKTLHDAVEHLERLARNPQYDSVQTGGDDEDCVRVMTIHAAKGLEFPVVIVTGLGRRRPEHRGSLIHDSASRELELKLSKEFATSGWPTAVGREEHMDDAERKRMLYVALTRARDHLVVSRYRCATKGDQTEAHLVAARLGTIGGGVPAVSVEAMQLAAVEKLPGTEVETDPEANRVAEAQWLEHRKDILGDLGSLRVTSATALAREADAAEGTAAADAAVQRRGRGGTSLGRAVHAVLQVIDLQSLQGLSDHAGAQAAAEGIPERAGEVERLVRRACATDAVQTASRSRHWRELPLGARLDGWVLEGFVDLLYQDAEGRLVVVDYKTDQISESEVLSRLDHYRPQADAYSVLIEAVTGKPIERVDFIFATLGSVRSIRTEGAATRLSSVLAKMGGSLKDDGIFALESRPIPTEGLLRNAAWPRT